ncbi:Carbonic anhydrase 2 [Caballeronia sp. SBC1]|uniref:carbonic anhydrase n=1 Tax=unclassified Caballeronia TaxID=2646786 RepID=UPI0013E1A82A|nr:MULTISPECIES: carbonic anhydrase [unclassified Caballeronia]QIE24408.1 Carbonic anhydrase 2 [Caballeronia sp. SBC2]QIN62300.1 Carbonic anhydrase 2 [Caballeronia sp. SBC1]
MNRPKRMLVENVGWAAEVAASDPDFFETLAQGQSPTVLWLGCSDSRVPAETITHSKPGDLFVHRNIANLFSPDDDNTMSVLEYAVNVLKVDDVIVCGHYGCGGVRASLLPLSDALPHVNRRIAPLCALARTHSSELDAMGTMDSRIDRLAELSVLEQVSALRDTAIVRDAERPPRVHGWIFGLRDGRIKVLSSGNPGEAETGGEPIAPSNAVAEPVPAPSAAQRVIETARH